MPRPGGAAAVAARPACERCYRQRPGNGRRPAPKVLEPARALAPAAAPALRRNPSNMPHRGAAAAAGSGVGISSPTWLEAGLSPPRRTLGPSDKPRAGGAAAGTECAASLRTPRSGLADRADPGGALVDAAKSERKVAMVAVAVIAVSAGALRCGRSSSWCWRPRCCTRARAACSGPPLRRSASGS